MPVRGSYSGAQCCTGWRSKIVEGSTCDVDPIRRLKRYRYRKHQTTTAYIGVGGVYERWAKKGRYFVRPRLDIAELFIELFHHFFIVE